MSEAVKTEKMTQKNFMVVTISSDVSEQEEEDLVNSYSDLGFSLVSLYYNSTENYIRYYFRRSTNGDTA